jgi:hypothetical protein
LRAGFDLSNLAGDMAGTADFPPAAELVAPGGLIVEKLGWQKGTWGGYLAAAGLWLAAQSQRPSQLVGAGTIAAGLGLAYLERRARLRPTAVCVRGARVGIYRAGKLDREAKLSELVLFQTNYFNTIRLLLLPCVGAVLGSIPLIAAAKPGGSAMSALDIAAGLALIAASVSSFASFAYTRHVWLVFRLPRPGKFIRWEDFNVARAEAGPLLGTPAEPAR